MVQQNKYEQLLSSETNDEKLFQIYTDYILDEMWSSNLDDCHNLYKRALKYFSNNREYIYELTMVEAKQYFFMEEKVLEGLNLFPKVTIPLDDVTNRLLFYRALYQFYYKLPISKDNISEPYLSLLDEIIDAYNNNDVEKFTSVMVGKLDAYKKLSSNEVTLLLHLKNQIKDRCLGLE